MHFMHNNHSKMSFYATMPSIGVPLIIPLNKYAFYECIYWGDIWGIA